MIASDDPSNRRCLPMADAPHLRAIARIVSKLPTKHSSIPFGAHCIVLESSIVSCDFLVPLVCGDPPGAWGAFVNFWNIEWHQAQARNLRRRNSLVSISSHPASPNPVVFRRIGIKHGQPEQGQTRSIPHFQSSSTMKTSFSFLTAILSLATSAYAHATFQTLWINGVSQGLLNGIRVPAYNGVRLLLQVLHDDPR
mgnify:CR=1 FL=1